MKCAIATALTLAIAGAIGAVLFAWSGLYNVSASSGHWPITTWFLHFTMRNSIETHAIGIEPPPLDHPALVYKGLGHYQGGCAPCHGQPGEAQGKIARHLLPRPPFLPKAVREWTPEQLFWIVRNGLKYTGMPAWPAPSRDDEAWAVVAALLRLPDMTAEEYRRITRGEAVFADTARFIEAAGLIGENLVACGRCHGIRGGGGGEGAFPRLAGQGETYLYEALRAYAIGSRPSGIMQPVAAELEDEDMRKLAAYYAAAGDEPFPPVPSVPEAVRERGRAIAEQGMPERRVAPCSQCHGSERHPLYPALDGQFAFYLAEQLRLWARGHRGTSPQAQVMDAALHALEEPAIRAVALYYASRRPEGR